MFKRVVSIFSICICAKLITLEWSCIAAPLGCMEPNIRSCIASLVAVDLPSTAPILSPSPQLTGHAKPDELYPFRAFHVNPHKVGWHLVLGRFFHPPKEELWVTRWRQNCWECVLWSVCVFGEPIDDHQKEKHFFFFLRRSPNYHPWWISNSQHYLLKESTIEHAEMLNQNILEYTQFILNPTISTSLF